MNDGIDPEVCSLQYTSVEKVARVAQRLGKGTLLAKVDIQAAYRLVPIHPGDRPLLGVKWGDACYFDGMLPFGLRSALKIFTAVADALEWCLRRSWVSHIDHYLDDYITMGAPATSECQHNLSLILDKCETLGVPIASEKLVGPSTCLTFLGIEIDTEEEVSDAPAGREVGPDTKSDSRLVSASGVPQAAIRVPYWPPSTCVSGCTSRAVLPPADDFPPQPLPSSIPPHSVNEAF